MADANTLTVDEALAAYRHADEIIRESDGDTEKLDNASDSDTSDDACPADFTEAQRRLAQQIVLDAYMRCIGRA